MGAPAAFRLIELGPGRGTLMNDALRALAVVPEVLDAAELHFVETSPRLGAEQRRVLAAGPLRPVWHGKLEDVPAGPAIIIANEFVDAIPVHQFVRRKTGWHERCVGLAAGGGFVFTEREAPLDAPETFIAGELLSAEIGSIVETRPGADQLISEFAARAKMAATAALIIDYGHLSSGTGETLQAIRAHQTADPLDAPGRADLTAHVDFASLARSARKQGLSVFGPISQGQFLLALGLAERCERLLASAAPEQAALLLSGARRLVDPREMGDLFKVLTVTDPARPRPPAFP
jgi:NADH dehydrogenase [ubiquinone] 1 alpha subcomplex assembly factor 7